MQAYQRENKLQRVHSRRWPVPGCCKSKIPSSFCSSNLLFGLSWHNSCIENHFDWSRAQGRTCPLYLGQDVQLERIATKSMYLWRLIDHCIFRLQNTWPAVWIAFQIKPSCNEFMVLQFLINFGSNFGMNIFWIEVYKTVQVRERKTNRLHLASCLRPAPKLIRWQWKIFADSIQSAVPLLSGTRKTYYLLSFKHIIQPVRPSYVLTVHQLTWSALFRINQ